MLSDEHIQATYRYCYALTAYEKSAFTLLMHFFSKAASEEDKKSSLTVLFQKISQQFYINYEDSGQPSPNEAAPEVSQDVLDIEELRVSSEKWLKAWPEVSPNDRAQLFIWGRNSKKSQNQLPLSARTVELLQGLKEEDTERPKLKALLFIQFKKVQLEEKKLEKIRKLTTVKQHDGSSETGANTVPVSKPPVEKSRADKENVLENHQNQRGTVSALAPEKPTTINGDSQQHANQPTQISTSKVNENPSENQNLSSESNEVVTNEVADEQAQHEKHPQASSVSRATNKGNDQKTLDQANFHETLQRSEIESLEIDKQNDEESETKQKEVKKQLEKQTEGSQSKSKTVNLSPITNNGDLKALQGKPEAAKEPASKESSHQTESSKEKMHSNKVAKDSTEISNVEPVNLDQAKAPIKDASIEQDKSKAESGETSSKSEIPDINRENDPQREDTLNGLNRNSQPAMEETYPNELEGEPAVVELSQRELDHAETAVRPIHPKLVEKTDSEYGTSAIVLEDYQAEDDTEISETDDQKNVIQNNFDRETIYAVFDQEFEKKMAEIEKSENTAAPILPKQFKRDRFFLDEIFYSVASISAIAVTVFFTSLP